jgi:hypothetical protein
MILLPLWRELLAERGIRLSAVYVIRNPLDVALSLEQRNRFPIPAGLALWHFYNQCGQAASAGLPTVYLSYDRLMENWRPAVHTMVKQLNLRAPDAETDARIQAMIKPAYRHGKTTDAMLMDRYGNSHGITLYRQLLDRVSD